MGDGFFRVDVETLADRIQHHPELAIIVHRMYELARDLVHEETIPVLEASQQQIERALELLADGKYFLLKVDDTYAGFRGEGPQIGYRLFQVLGDTTTRISDGEWPFRISNIASLCQESEITTVYVRNIGEDGFVDIKTVRTDDQQHSITISKPDPEAINYLKGHGIDVIDLSPSLD